MVYWAPKARKGSLRSLDSKRLTGVKKGLADVQNSSLDLMIPFGATKKTHWDSKWFILNAIKGSKDLSEAKKRDSLRHNRVHWAPRAQKASHGLKKDSLRLKRVHWDHRRSKWFFGLQKLNSKGVTLVSKKTHWGSNGQKGVKKRLTEPQNVVSVEQWLAC